MNFPPGNLVGLLGEPHDSQFVAHVVRGVLAALASYHERGRSYGQVRPDTIYLAADGRVRLGDVRATIVSTQVEAPEGLSKYLPPETLAAEVFGEVGPATDVYALGLIAIELLVGSRFSSLFAGVADDPLGGDLAWMRWHGDAEKRLPPVAQIVPGVDANLAAAIDRMTAKRVSERPADASQVLAMLDDPTSAPSVVPPPRDVSKASSNERPVDTAAEEARRTTDSGAAATVYFEDTLPPEDSPSQGLSPLEGWSDDIRNTPRVSAPADEVADRVADTPPHQPTDAPPMEPEPAPVADVPQRSQSAVRGTMMPDEDDLPSDMPPSDERPSDETSSHDAAVAAAAPTSRPPRRDPDLPPAMRLARRRGPFDHPATLATLSLAVIAGVAYLLFFAWPAGDVTHTVEINSEPTGAKVSIDGVASGEKTDAKLPLAIGKHDIVVSLDGYYDAKKTIEIAEGDDQRKVVLELKKIPTARLVRIASEPSDAAVYLDGNPAPLAKRTPAEELLSLGRHTLLVKKAGYQDATALIDVALGDDRGAGTQPETIALSPVPKRIENVVVRIDPADASFTADGKPVAAAMGKATMPIEEGAKVELAASAEGYADWTRAFSFDELEQAQFTVDVDLDPYVSFVPPEAAVAVNDAPLPLDGGRAVLPAAPDRRYHIVAMAPGYATLDVTLSRSELAQRKFRLELTPGPRPPASLRQVAEGRFVHDALDKAGAPLNFVVVEPGEFVFGAAADGIRNGELKRSAAEIDSPFLISTTEVSVRQYAIFAAAEGEAKAGVKWRPDAVDAAANLPVTNVTYEQAKNFADYVGGKLPSEKQWERAARGVGGRTYPWQETDEPSKQRCNLGFQGGESLVPVDALPDGATPEGVLNMLGNAAEWCEDLYEPGYRDIDDKTPGIRKFPTIRGGSYLDPYDNTMRNARATMRANANPASGGRDIGFRVVVPFTDGK
ncbi:MAG: SUMF1/EgtB/PvdO family nonheme iron enzyme [Pirellulales bacterium]